MLLTQEEFKRFQNDGFIVKKQFAKQSTCDEILQTVQKHICECIAPFESEQEYLGNSDKSLTLRRLRQVYQREAVFQKWMHNSNNTAVLKQLLQETPVLTLAHHNSIMTKMPHESSITSWHQDKRYWHYENDNLISVWLSLGDEFLENGLLEFIPGSHKVNFKPEQFDKKLAFREDLAINQELIQKRVHTNLQKGDVVFFHCKVLHYAGKNTTDKAKVSFVYTAKAASTKPLKGTRSDFDEVILD